MPQTQERYDSTSIVVLEGLEGVRRRPGMYIGDDQSRGFHHLLWEILDNAVDEALAGYCTQIDVTLWGDRAEVRDDGRGIPVDVHAQTGKSALETIFTTLHAGGKFGNSAYRVSGGLHGVGSSVVNALSEWLEVEVRRDGKHCCQVFRRGIPDGSLRPVRRVSDWTPKTGTLVRFRPDPEIFRCEKDREGKLPASDPLIHPRFTSPGEPNVGPKACRFHPETVRRRLTELSSLLGGNVTFHLRYPRIRKSDPDAPNPDAPDTLCSETEHLIIRSEGGVADLVRHAAGDDLLCPPITCTGCSRDGLDVDFSLSACSDDGEQSFSYVNLIPTRDGGTHLTGFRAGLTRAVNETAKRQGLLKDKDGNLSGDEVREGLVAVIHVRMPNPQFEGQTKGRLSNAECAPSVAALVYDALCLSFESKSGRGALKTLVERAMTARKTREAVRKAKETVKKSASRNKEGFGLPGKLADCTAKNPEAREIFLVEGDSAGGNANQARDRSFQAILPLRGKVLNCARVPLHKALDNTEVRGIIQVLGCGAGKTLDLSKLRYHKIIILSDADVDGAHIRCLLLTLFHRFLPGLLESGMVYVSRPPLYRLQHKNEIRYCLTDEDYQAVLKETGRGRKRIEWTVQRFKGLGEMNADHLRTTAMDPATRSLARVRLEEADTLESHRVLMELMGNDVESRRRFLEENAADFLESAAELLAGVSKGA